MGIFDRFRQKGTLSGTIELRGLPTNCGYSVAVCLFAVEGESSPPPFNGAPPPSAYSAEIYVKEKDDSEQKPLTFKAQRRIGYYYVDVGLIVYFERDGKMFAQVEHFMPMRTPTRIQVNQKTKLNLVVQWPTIPFEQLHTYGTVYPRAQMSSGAKEVKWLVPWYPILQDDEGPVRELRKELSKRHVLFGIPVRAVAHRQDCDDFLFELLDGTGRFAVVHLTYAQHPEPDPRWPETIVYENWSEFERNRMSADAADWND